MHSPSARALRHLDRYCIVLVRTLKHVSPAKCVITITYSTLATLVALVNIHFVDSSIDTYEISVISVDAGNTLCA